MFTYITEYRTTRQNRKWTNCTVRFHDAIRWFDCAARPCDSIIRLIARLIAWLIAWLIARLIARLIAWLIVRFDGSTERLDAPTCRCGLYGVPIQFNWSNCTVWRLNIYSSMAWFDDSAIWWFNYLTIQRHNAAIQRLDSTSSDATTRYAAIQRLDSTTSDATSRYDDFDIDLTSYKCLHWNKVVINKFCTRCNFHYDPWIDCTK